MLPVFIIAGALILVGLVLMLAPQSVRRQPSATRRITVGALVAAAGAFIAIRNVTLNRLQPMPIINIGPTLTQQASERAELDGALAPLIPSLMEQASQVPRRMRASALGVSLPGDPLVDFGRCETDNTFYLYVINVGREFRDYMFVDGSLCPHPVLRHERSEDIGRGVLGGTWRHIPDLYGVNATIAAPPTPETTPTGD